MFCRNCGAEIDKEAAICVKCGFKNGQGNKFCPNCGSETSEGQSVCLSCGHSLRHSSGSAVAGSVPEERRILCGVLAIVIGTIGIHNFILGEHKKGILHIILLLLSFTGIALLLDAIWSIIEGIKILNRSYVVNPDKWFAI